MDKRFIILLIFFTAFARLIPHPANVSPLLSVCLFAGANLSRRVAVLSVFIILVLSDFLLSHLNNTPIFGSWTIFTYSGFAALILVGQNLSHSPVIKKLIGYILISSLGFWLWTNFGVWLLSGIYAKTLTGFVACYVAALPFLRNSLLGDLFWMSIIFGMFQLLRKCFSPLKYAKSDSFP